MGLDVSHDAFSGAYSAFNSLRQEIARTTGGSYPPHVLLNADGSYALDARGDIQWDCSMDATQWYWGDGYSKASHPGLYAFFSHSDCDGKITPAMCVKVADELERVIPLVEARGTEIGGHIGRDGGFVKVIQKFIAGCRAAANEGVPLEFY